MCDVYTKEKVGLINREFSVSFPHPKGGNFIWTCVKDHTTNEKDKDKAIGICCFYYKLFEEGEGERTIVELNGYPYLKHLIKLWQGDWVKHMAKMNEAFGMKNRLMMGGGGKRIVCPFISQEFWKCIGGVLLEVTYGKKGHNIWS